MITLEQLRDHARRNPDNQYPLDSCFECLAARMTARPMDGWYKTLDGEHVDPAFGDFCKHFSDLRLPEDRFAFIRGSIAADAIQSMIDGETPRNAADRAAERTRNVV